MAVLMASSDLVAFINWTMSPFMSEVWDHIYQEIVAPSEKVEELNQSVSFLICAIRKKDRRRIFSKRRLHSTLSKPLFGDGLNEECYGEVMVHPTQKYTSR